MDKNKLRDFKRKKIFLVSYPIDKEFDVARFGKFDYSVTLTIFIYDSILLNLGYRWNLSGQGIY